MRPAKHETFMKMALVLSELGTCRRRKVGCILVDHHNRIIGSGYNGAPSGAPHCLTNPCLGATDVHGELDRCEAIHAEQNALLQCRDTQEIAAIYTTSFPCIHCFKMIANTSCCQIFFHQDYLAHQQSVMEFNAKLLVPLEFHAVKPVL